MDDGNNDAKGSKEQGMSGNISLYFYDFDHI